MNSRKTLKEMVVDDIFKDIEEGVYKPNDIITENSLVAKYNISKSPVREALVELCKDNVLKSLPRLGYQVVPITLKEVLDIIEFRLDLEMSTLRRAFARMTEENVKELKAIAMMVPEDYLDTITPYWLRNQEFHIYLCEISGNEYTCKILKDTLKQSSRYISQYFRAAWNKSVESKGKYHLAIAEAMEQRDLKMAEKMLEKDILAVKNQIQQIYRI